MSSQRRMSVSDFNLPMCLQQLFILLKRLAGSIKGASCGQDNIKSKEKAGIVARIPSRCCILLKVELSRCH